MGHIKEVLSASELFEGLTSGELDKIATLCWEQAYEPGSFIFMEGDEAKACSKRAVVSSMPW